MWREHSRSKKINYHDQIQRKTGVGYCYLPFLSIYLGIPFPFLPEESDRSFLSSSISLTQDLSPCPVLITPLEWNDDWWVEGGNENEFSFWRKIISRIRNGPFSLYDL